MSRPSAACGPLIALFLVAAPARAADAPAAPPPVADAALPSSALLERVAPAIVSVKLVLRGDEHEFPHQCVGAVVDPTGIVVLANAHLGSEGQRAIDLKVTFGNDPKELEAVVVARDSVLGWGWLQVLGLEKPVVGIDLAASGEPALGADLRSVWRLGRGFDYAPVVSRHYVSARVEKPRLMWAASGDDPPLGVPVFDGAGAVAGVTASQAASEGDEDDEGSAAFVLPVAEARRSLEAARKRVAEAVEKAKSSKEKEPEPAKPDAARDGDAGKTPEPAPAGMDGEPAPGGGK